MFIERSVAKIRGVRTLFVLLGILPCAVLVGWAAVRHSATHRDAMRRRAEAVLGMPVSIGAVEHVRPGAMRLRECAIAAGAGETVLAIPEVEVETSADEVRLRLPAATCGPSAVAALARLAGAWLDEPVRFPRAWIVEIDAFDWEGSAVDAGLGGAADDAGAGRPFALRIECVAAGGARAVRLRRDAEHEGGDELRVIVTDGSPRRYEVRASIREPVPWSVVRPVLAPGVAVGLPMASATRLNGSLAMVSGPDGWTGHASGLIEGIDLGSLSAAGRISLEGALELKVERLEWDAGRLVGVEANGSAVRGRIAQSLLGALVSTCGCRPGPAFQSLGAEPMRPFDDLEVGIALDAQGVRLSAGADRDGSLMRRQGLSLLDEPRGAIPFDRLAWLAAPAGGPAVPVSAASSWLMRLLPVPAGRGEASTAIRPPSQSRGRSEF